MSKTREVLKRVGGSRDFNKDTFFLSALTAYFLGVRTFSGSEVFARVRGVKFGVFPAPVRTADSGGQAWETLEEYIYIYIYLPLAGASGSYS